MVSAADQKAIRDARTAGAAKLKADNAASAAALAADKQKLKNDEAQLEKDSKA